MSQVTTLAEIQATIDEYSKTYRRQVYLGWL